MAASTHVCCRQGWNIVPGFSKLWISVPGVPATPTNGLELMVLQPCRRVPTPRHVTGPPCRTKNHGPPAAAPPPSEVRIMARPQGLLPKSSQCCAFLGSTLLEDAHATLFCSYNRYLMRRSVSLGYGCKLLEGLGMVSRGMSLAPPPGMKKHGPPSRCPPPPPFRSENHGPRQRHGRAGVGMLSCGV